MSKSRELSEKYETIRKTVRSNLETIRTLVAQADTITSLIEETPDEALRGRLKESVKNLYATIDTLIEDSNKLFDQYLDFANSVAD
jgi:phosphoribosylaminoimidazole carboxylase (NCAIR synthetase)